MAKKDIKPFDEELHKRNMKRLLEAQTRYLEAADKIKTEGAAFYDGYNNGNHTVVQDGKITTGIMNTNAGVGKGDRVIKRADQLNAMPTVQRPQTKATPAQKAGAAGKIKFIFSRTAAFQGKQCTEFYVAGWRQGRRDFVYRYPNLDGSMRTRLLKAIVDNLGGDGWEAGIAYHEEYTKVITLPGGEPSTIVDRRVLNVVHIKNGKVEWKFRHEVKQGYLGGLIGGYGYGFWRFQWKEAVTNVDGGDYATPGEINVCGTGGGGGSWGTEETDHGTELILYKGLAYERNIGGRYSIGSISSFTTPPKPIPVVYPSGDITDITAGGLIYELPNQWKTQPVYVQVDSRDPTILVKVLGPAMGDSAEEAARAARQMGEPYTTKVTEYWYGEVTAVYTIDTFRIRGGWGHRCEGGETKIERSDQMEERVWQVLKPQNSEGGEYRLLVRSASKDGVGTSTTVWVNRTDKNVSTILGGRDQTLTGLGGAFSFNAYELFPPLGGEGGGAVHFRGLKDDVHAEGDDTYEPKSKQFAGIANINWDGIDLATPSPKQNTNIGTKIYHINLDLTAKQFFPGDITKTEKQDQPPTENIMKNNIFKAIWWQENFAKPPSTLDAQKKEEVLMKMRSPNNMTLAILGLAVVQTYVNWIEQRPSRKTEKIYAGEQMFPNLLKNVQTQYDEEGRPLPKPSMNYRVYNMSYHPGI